MGHDIHAIEPKVIAETGRAAFDLKNSMLYKVLDATDAYGGVSGNDVYMRFTKEEIQTALDRLLDVGFEDEENFLRTILSTMKEDSIIIRFF